MTRPLAFLICLIAAVLHADDAIEGVQPAALDQPRIELAVYRDARGPALAAKDDPNSTEIQAFLDTGASGIVISNDTARQLGLQASRTAEGKAVTFEDVGVGGSEKFDVSEPIFLAVGDDEQRIGPVRTQIKTGGGLMDLIVPGLDVAGTPVMFGKVVVIDPKRLAEMDLLRTSVLPPNDPRIPRTSIHVPLTNVSFAAFTRVQPAGAPAPVVEGNPMIGPNPFIAGDKGKPVMLRHGGRETGGTFLLDTGAATSILSIAMARKLGIKVNDDGSLPDLPVQAQFQLAVGGIGGMKSSHGLFIDRLELPTRQGPPVAYSKVPLLIADITVVGKDGKPFTLDGVIGMNMLVASAEITGGLLPDIGKIVQGPYKWIVIDLHRGDLCLEMK